ncbi:MAG: tetratricopeptide repeat protein, partial [Pirellulales bacterium]|nr:tetratricopeptide repeat protein [Pirellulales bacterium]
TRRFPISLDDHLSSRNRRMRRLEVMLQHRATREAEGYLELGMHQHALDALERQEHRELLGFQASYLAGEALRGLGRHEEALAMYEQSAELNPENVDLYVAMGTCYKRLGEIDIAIEVLEDALIVEPGNSVVLYNLACYWSLARRPRRSLNFLHRALDQDWQLSAMLSAEPDFDPIRQDPRFRSLAEDALVKRSS